MALYTAGNVSTLEILLDSESLSDFTTRMQLVDSMTAHDQELVDKLEAYVDSTSAEREQVEAQKLRKTGLSPRKSDSCTVLPWASSIGKAGAGLACWDEEEEVEPSDWLGSWAS